MFFGGNTSNKIDKIFLKFGGQNSNSKTDKKLFNYNNKIAHCGNMLHVDV